MACYIFGAGSYYGLRSKPDVSDYVIAADGGWRWCRSAGLTPDLLLGDFDSLGEVPAFDHILRVPVEKDDTDMMLAIKKGLERGCREFHLYGGTGGRRSDHTVANYQALLYLARRGARLAQYDRGALVHGCDGQCLGMIRVQTGRLRACMLSDDGREITLYRLTDGDACVLAAACVIRQITFEVQLVADAPTELLILGAHVFQQLTAENIHVECCMYRLATERFSDVMWAMQQLLFTSFDKRLAQYLWDESGHARAPVRATHEQIARDTGAVRETVTRMLRHFADDGIVSLGRGTVTVTDAEKLRRLAGM